MLSRACRPAFFAKIISYLKVSSNMNKQIVTICIPFLTEYFSSTFQRPILNFNMKYSFRTIIAEGGVRDAFH